MLMRSIKSTGGLKRGRGMIEVQRSVWIKSLPACSQNNQSMQDFTGTAYHTSEQQVEAFHTRVTRDREDTFFYNKNPLCCLTNISSDSLSKTYVDRSQ